MVAYLKVGPQVRTYSDYLRAAQEAEKEDSIELPWGAKTQVTNTPPKPRATSFFPLRKLKGNQPILKKPAVHLVHLEEEDVGDDEDQESDDPSEESKELWKSSWYTWQGPLRMPKQMKNAATIVAAWNISSIIAPW